jgi:hypothetical protein
MLSIAVDELSKRIAPEVIVVCEGSAAGTRRKDFDAEIYNRIFGQHVPGLLFISGGSSTDVARNGLSINRTLQQIVPDSRVVALADRDDKSDAEVADWERTGNIVLPERNLESYLFADDVMKKLSRQNGHAGDILQLKKDALAASVSRGNPADDVKSASGQLYVALKKELSLTRSGNNADAFMRDTLALLITPDTDAYRKLKAGIVDRITGRGT